MAVRHIRNDPQVSPVQFGRVP